MNNDNLRVDNYFGSKKNHYADGNGGRFRYFNVIKLDGKILHLNEMLAKAEYDGNEQAYSDILNTVRNLFTDKKIDKNGNTTYGETVKRVVNGVLLAYCDKEISKAINLGVIDESLKSKILPDDFVKEFDKIAESASKTNKAVITEKDKIYSMIASNAINSAVSIIEIEKCFTGDPALYKWQKQFTVYKPNDDSFKETSAKNLDDFFKQENKKREKEGLERILGNVYCLRYHICELSPASLHSIHGISQLLAQMLDADEINSSIVKNNLICTKIKVGLRSCTKTDYMVITIHYASILAYVAFFSINSLRGSTSSPISMEKISSASAAFSILTCFRRRVLGSIVVSQS